MDFFAISAVPSAEIRVVEVKKTKDFFRFLRRRSKTESCLRSAWSMCSFSILNTLARPSARIVRVEALSLRRANVLLANWSLEVVAWSARLLSESRGRAAPAGKSQLLSTTAVRGAQSCSSGCIMELFNQKTSTRSTSRKLRQHLRRATFTERCRLRRATCAKQIAQSTCT